MSITAIILTYNEEKHVKRCIKSIIDCVERIVVVDSFSTDSTCQIAAQLGADIYKNKWVNYAEQFNWALANCHIDTKWVMRIDADEYFTPELTMEIMTKIESVSSGVNGIVLNRRVYFMGKWIRYGGSYPIKLLRIWRTGYGSVERRWMDEHVKLSSGTEIQMKNDFIDENLNNLTWWINKQNNYACREVVDLLNFKYSLFDFESIADSYNTLSMTGQHKVKRWIKTNIYQKSPLFLRGIFFYLYRYIWKLGFLDGIEGFVWQFMHVLWYRMLVDAKLLIVERKILNDYNNIKKHIKEELGISI